MSLICIEQNRLTDFVFLFPSFEDVICPVLPLLNVLFLVIIRILFILSEAVPNYDAI